MVYRSFVLCNVSFLIGSVLFFPNYGSRDQRAGTWIFIFGSAAFLVLLLVDLCDTAYLRVLPVKWQLGGRVLRTSSYLLSSIGCFFFVLGSIWFLFPNSPLYPTAVTLFVIGSACFMFASMVVLYGRILYHYYRLHREDSQ